MIRFIGDHLLARTAAGVLETRIATAFPRAGVIITLPGIHATQRCAFTEDLNHQRGEKGLPPLTDAEEDIEWKQSVDLILDDESVMIRPDPEHMDLAFEADEMLQELISKRRIKFLHVLNHSVRQAIQQRGEAWRIYPLPKSPEEMLRMISASRIAIGGLPIYYYNVNSGSRYLTFQEFAGLSSLDDALLRQHLAEIALYSGLHNRRGKPEINFFLADGGIRHADFAAFDFLTLDSGRMREAHETLRRKFQAAVPEELREDAPDDDTWRNHMYCALIDYQEDVVSEETLLGLSSEFFMQIEWLPGGRLEQGELIFDPVFDENTNDPDRLRFTPFEDSVRGLMCNLVQEYEDVEYVNIGRVMQSLSHRGPQPGRPDVFVAQIKQRGGDHEILQIIRMQKWGVRERLDEGKDLLRAMIETEEYTEYILDRRLGCRQLGMNLPRRNTSRKLTERYLGSRQDVQGITIWSPYFQRDYIAGTAADKIPAGRLKDGAFALALARLLGSAAAPNMIVGRADSLQHRIFDEGDEIVVEGPGHVPRDIVMANHTGTFNDFRGNLCEAAVAYAAPVNRRIPHLSDRRTFADVYVEAFVKRFSEVQAEYRNRKRAFDSLFRHRRSDPAGNFAFRWQCVLDRLNRADPRALGKLIREHIEA
jgi:hypothetical protein